MSTPQERIERFRSAYPGEQRLDRSVMRRRSAFGVLVWGAVLLLGQTGCRRSGLDAEDEAMLAPERLAALDPVGVVRRLRLPRNAVVADVGAGPGALTLVLGRAAPYGRVIATDIKPGALEALQKRARAQGLTNVETRVVTPTEPGLDPGSLDLAVLCQVDHLLPGRIHYLRALTAALRPGGRIALIHQRSHLPNARALLGAAGLVIVDEQLPASRYFLLIAAPLPTPKRP